MLGMTFWLLPILLHTLNSTLEHVQAIVSTTKSVLELKFQVPCYMFRVQLLFFLHCHVASPQEHTWQLVHWGKSELHKILRCWATITYLQFDLYLLADTLAKSWKTVSFHECKVWLPHGRLKASLGHTELKKAKLIRWHLNVRLFKRETNTAQSKVIMKWLNDGMQVLGLAWSHKVLTDTNMTTSYDPNILGMSSRCIMQVRFHNLRWASSLAQDSPKVLVPPAVN